MQEITINFGLIASEKFPAVARARVLANDRVLQLCDGGDGVFDVPYIRDTVLKKLRAIGCVVDCHVTRINHVDATLVIKCSYPWQSEIDDCAAPSVLKYEPYMRLYELTAYFAQDCVAVLEADGTGVLVGANCSDWGCSFDKTKFITLGE